MKKLLFVFTLLVISLTSFGQIMMTSEVVNLRSTPEIKENKICVIKKGELVKIDSIYKNTTEWYRVFYNGNTGYIFYKYLIDVSNELNNLLKNVAPENIKYYTNSKGHKVQSPTKYNSAPAGATAECNDGTYSFSQSRRGTCSHHGGVKRWL